MRSFILRLWRSKSPIARALRATYHGSSSFSIPFSRRAAQGWVLPWTAVITVWRWLLRVLIVDPMIRSHATSVGERFRAGSHIPFVSGSGDLRIGDNVTFAGKISFLLAWRDTPARISIGSDTYIGHNALFSSASSVSVGSHCLLSNDVTVLDSPGHHVDPVLRRAGLPPAPEDVRPVTIGNNVWIGLGALILPGVVIGDDAVIAARSVVTGSIPAGVLAAGSPARVVKHLSREEERSDARTSPDERDG
jgi:acetyltransferase-like isoleucine patch superfamily enzyme